MPAFYIAAVAMVIAALAFILVPLLRAVRAAGTVDRTQSNIAVLRQQREEILREHASGVSSAAERDEALAELTERAGEDVLGAPAQPPAVAVSRRAAWISAAAIAALVPLLAAGLYAKLGSPDALKLAATATPQAPAFSDKQIVAMVDSLAEKMKQKPDDAQGWILLGRSQNALGRFPEAVKAYERANALQPNDPNVLADYADALGMTQQGSLAGKPAALVQQALQIDPGHRKALALAGTAELNDRHFPKALEYWQRLRSQLPDGSEDARQVDGAIEEIRIAMGAPGGGADAAKNRAGAGPQAGSPPVAAAPAQQTASPPVAGGGAKAVAGRVDIAPALAQKVALTDTVFILARAANWQSGGPRMPLAVLRIPAKDLPRDFELSDAMAMAPNMKLSDFPDVVVEARISKSGGAASQPGDLQGLSAAVKPGAKGVHVVIDKVVQ